MPVHVGCWESWTFRQSSVPCRGLQGRGIDCLMLSSYHRVARTRGCVVGNAPAHGLPSASLGILYATSVHSVVATLQFLRLPAADGCHIRLRSGGLNRQFLVSTAAPLHHASPQAPEHLPIACAQTPLTGSLASPLAPSLTSLLSPSIPNPHPTHTPPSPPSSHTLAHP